jgi:hypothetical protein
VRHRIGMVNGGDVFVPGRSRRGQRPRERLRREGMLLSMLRVDRLRGPAPMIRRIRLGIPRRRRGMRSRLNFQDLDRMPGRRIIPSFITVTSRYQYHVRRRV